MAVPGQFYAFHPIPSSSLFVSFSGTMGWSDFPVSYIVRLFQRIPHTTQWSGAALQSVTYLTANSRLGDFWDLPTSDYVLLPGVLRGLGLRGGWMVLAITHHSVLSSPYRTGWTLRMIIISQLNTLLTSSPVNACSFPYGANRHNSEQCGLLALTLRRLALPVVRRFFFSAHPDTISGGLWFHWRTLQTRKCDLTQSGHG